MIKAGVIGHPITHSKSPLIHGYWLKKYALDGEYKAYDIAPDNLEQGIKGLISSGLVGFNVTIPHKQKIMSLCSTLSEEAKSIGAVNTVTVQHDGTLYGHNTDAFGFSKNLEETVPDFKWNRASPALIIGAGGAARAIASALKSQGVEEIRITNRTAEAAESLAADFGLITYDWSNRNNAPDGAGLLVQTTSLGMQGQPPLDLDIKGVTPDAIIYDIVYNPLMTGLLQQAKTEGRKFVTGIGMLLHQARPGFESWFGQYPDVDAGLVELLTPKNG